MSTDKELNDDLYGGDLYAGAFVSSSPTSLRQKLSARDTVADPVDLDLEELDATQLDEELEDLPDLQPVSDTPATTNGQAQQLSSNYGQQQQLQPQLQYQQQQQQQQPGQFGFGQSSGQGQGYGGMEGIDRLRSGDQHDEGKMFIGGLNWETTEENLRQYMSQYGPIDACTIMRDPNGRSRGFAFLTYESSDSVNKVLAEVHHLDGKQIDPKRAIPRAEHERTAKVFVGGLAASVTSESLKVFLTQFGPVMDATVMFDRETGRSKGFAFATFGNEESVGVAMAASGVELEGKAIEIKKAQPRGSGNLPIKFPGQAGIPGAVHPGAARVGGMGMMGNMGGAGAMGMGMGGGMNMGMGGGAAFDPSAMMMMYQNMMKNSMGGMGMGGGVDPNAMAMMYQNMMKNMTGMNAPAINPSMARGGMGMMNPMAGMMGGMGMGGMAPGMGMGGYGGQGMGVPRPPAAGVGARAIPNAPRGPAAMRTEGGTTPTGALGGTGVAGPMNGASGTGAQRYSTQGAARSRPY